ncbi:MAG: GIY-YIG nuclease family protein [Rivularia sp. (in: cyanobacteria)]
MKGKTIRIFLVEGTPNSILTAEIINWTGKVIVAPRSQLPELASRIEAKRTGVYILAGDDPQNPLKERIYIGESDNVFKRLTEHNKDDNKDFWTRSVLIISKDENLTKSHIRYLESKLIQLAQQAKRGTLDNNTAPGIPPLPESDTADMEFFLSQVQMLLPVLGFSFALPAPKPIPADEFIDRDNNIKPQNISPIFYMKASGAEAKAQEIDGEFIVLRGSTARKESVKSLSKRGSELREQLIEEGKLINNQDERYLVFREDIPFTSPSAAADTIAGGSYNGRTAWKVIDTDKTYKEWQEIEIEKAEENNSVSENQLIPFQGDNEEVSVPYNIENNIESNR